MGRKKTVKPENVVAEEVVSKFKLKKDGTPKLSSMCSNIAKKSKEERVELAKAAQKKSVEAREKKYTFRDILNQTLTNNVRKNIAKEYIEMITDKNVKVTERIKILELILKLIGELENNKTSVEFNEENSVIKLEIS